MLNIIRREEGSHPGAGGSQGKNRTRYVRPEWVDEIRGQIEVCKRFKKLIEEWIDLSIASSG